MEDWFDMSADESRKKRERVKAREVKLCAWYQALLNKGVCHYCGKKFSRAQLTMDHIVPVARGGRSIKGNIVVACKECNNEKKYLTPVDIILAKIEDSKEKQPK